MEFKLQDLALLASDINYIPGLGVAVNKALSVRGKKSEYDVALKEATALAIGYKDVEITEPTDYGAGSIFGLPLWQPLKLEDKDEVLSEMLLESAVVELNRTKNIVTTVIQGRDTSVDEFINNGDWDITVSGLLVSSKIGYPLDEVKDFQKYMDLNRSIKVTHEVMNELGIYEIVVLSHSLPKTPHWNIQQYSFTAKSTKPLPLIIDLKATAPKY